MRACAEDGGKGERTGKQHSGLTEPTAAAGPYVKYLSGICDNMRETPGSSGQYLTCDHELRHIWKVICRGARCRSSSTGMTTGNRMVQMRTLHETFHLHFVHCQFLSAALRTGAHATIGCPKLYDHRLSKTVSPNRTCTDYAGQTGVQAHTVRMNRCSR